MPDETPNKLFQDSIVVSYDGHTYEFRIPSVLDRTKISARSAQLWRDATPEGTMPAQSMDIMDDLYMRSLSTFLTLIKATDTDWVFIPDTHGQPTIDISRWPSDAPIMEVVEEFSKELEKFRENKAKS